MDTDININDSINNIFTIIKRDYLKNKTKPLTIKQVNIINILTSKYLRRHFRYDTILYYHPNCSQPFSSKRVSSKRRKSFNNFNSQKSKSRYNSAFTI
jgi:hypothetical protein